MRSIGRTALVVDGVVGATFVLVTWPFIYTVGGWLEGGALDVPALFVFGGALTLRRLSPATALGVAWAGAALQLFTLRDPQVFDLATVGVLYATAAYGGSVVRWLGLASAPVGAACVSLYLIYARPVLSGRFYLGLDGSFGGDGAAALGIFVAVLLLLLVSWLIGMLVRSTRARQDSSRQVEEATRELELTEYQVVVEQERNRIARDMHDVVAHSLAVVIAQADGARFAAAQRPEAAPEALETIAGVARGALGDVRMLLAELRHDEGDTPQPVMADLEELIGQLRNTGLEVVLRETGERVTLSPSHEIAAYRIVQEALTNALRHGDTSRPVVLSLLWDESGVWIDVVNALRARDDPNQTAPHPQRHGIPGMRERAQLAGGAFFADATPEDAFHLRARVPR